MYQEAGIGGFQNPAPDKRQPSGRYAGIVVGSPTVQWWRGQAWQAGDRR